MRTAKRLFDRVLMLTREEDALGKFRSVYGAAGSQPEACQAFYRQGSARLIDELATYLRRADGPQVCVCSQELI